MALTDEQQVELEAKLAAAEKALEESKAAKEADLDEVEESDKTKVVKETTKKEVNADYAKSISTLEARILELENRLKTGSASGLRPVLKVD